MYSLAIMQIKSPIADRNADQIKINLQIKIEPKVAWTG